MSLCLEKRRVGFSGDRRSERYCLLFKALSELYPVEFIEVAPPVGGQLDALLVLDGNIGGGMAAAGDGLPSFVVVAGDGGTAEAANGEVCFGSSMHLDEHLRGQVMAEKDGRAVLSLAVQPGDEVLASKGGHPVWLSRRAGRGACQLVATAPPALRDGEFMFEHLNARRFLPLLPLMNFLRQLVKPMDWLSVSPRCCFVFDDPNLHRPSYGFLDYRLLAGHAAEHSYFVSIATVPLDAWWVNKSVAAIFRSASPRLSLLVHGNNHTFHELSFRRNGVTPLALAAQALCRMERLERSHSLAFSRVLEAPHAVIATEAIGPLVALGYEGALATMEQLVKANPHALWPASVGMARLEMLGGGLALIPRIKMTAHWKNDVLLAAFLKQPIVVAGHHRDARKGLELQADFANLINNLGGSVWATPQGIARTQYEELRQGDALHIRTYSRTVEACAPEGVKRLFVHRPWLRSEEDGEALSVKCAGQEPFLARGTAIVGPVPIRAPGVLEICSPPPDRVDYRTVRPPRTGCWPVLRKVLTEFRDRSTPCRVWAASLYHRSGTKLRNNT